MIISALTERITKHIFPSFTCKTRVEVPLKSIDSTDKFDVVVNPKGGEVKGKAEAVKLGITWALLQLNPEYRPALKEAGLLTRDPRSVERKKLGKKKARKSFQFSKR